MIAAPHVPCQRAHCGRHSWSLNPSIPLQPHSSECKKDVEQEIFKHRLGLQYTQAAVSVSVKWCKRLYYIVKFMANNTA